MGSGKVHGYILGTYHAQTLFNLTPPPFHWYLAAEKHTLFKWFTNQRYPTSEKKPFQVGSKIWPLLTIHRIFNGKGWNTKKYPMSDKKLNIFTSLGEWKYDNFLSRVGYFGIPSFNIEDSFYYIVFILKIVIFDLKISFFDQKVGKKV